MITVTCGHCNGQGVVPLPKHLQHVLDYIGTGEATTPDLVHTADTLHGEFVTINAMCNRLKALEAFGLVEKRRAKQTSGGCWYFWRRMAEL